MSQAACSWTVIGLLATSALVGCGTSRGVDRYGVSGTVTHGGQPVAKGTISIEPDKAKGNSGPRGYAEIEQGNFRIRSNKGIVAGPVIVTIEGGDGQNISRDEGRPYGNPLFPRYVTSLEFTGDNQELTIDVP